MGIMNRRARRRAAKVGDVLNVDFARYRTTATSVLTCYVCNKPAPAWTWPDGLAGYGMAVIDGHLRVWLCRQCFENDPNGVVRTYWRFRDLKLHEGGEIDSLDTVYEIADALAEKEKATEQ
jgi:hypothetical protein